MSTSQKFIVALKVRSRFFRSSVGLFEYHPASERQVWRGESTSDPARLAELVNEGLHFLQVQNLVDHVMEVVPVEGSETEDAPNPAIVELEAKVSELSATIEAKDAELAQLKAPAQPEKPDPVEAPPVEPEPEVEVEAVEETPAEPEPEVAEAPAAPTPVEAPAQPEKPNRRKRRLLTK